MCRLNHMVRKMQEDGGRKKQQAQPDTAPTHLAAVVLKEAAHLTLAHIKRHIGNKGGEGGLRRQVGAGGEGGEEGERKGELYERG